jgi:hypothetical protein
MGEPRVKALGWASARCLPDLTNVASAGEWPKRSSQAFVLQSITPQQYETAIKSLPSEQRGAAIRRHQASAVDAARDSLTRRQQAAPRVIPTSGRATVWNHAVRPCRPCWRPAHACRNPGEPGRVVHEPTASHRNRASSTNEHADAPRRAQERHSIEALHRGSRTVCPHPP